MTTPGDSDKGPIVLFDGVCNMCNASVNFVLDHDATKQLRFASLQSDVGRRLMEAHGAPLADEPSSIVLVESGVLYGCSTAALRVTRHLGGAWKFLYAFIVVPRPLRDLVYRFVARNRYRWFGKTEICRVPTPELRSRFLDGNAPT